MGFFDNIGGARNITDVLNIWNEIGVFSYVLPFILIFAIVFSILDKSKILETDASNKNRPMLAIISVAVGLLSLQFDFVSEFFAVLFPRFGMGIAILLTVMIFIAFTGQGLLNRDEKDETWRKFMNAAGWVVGISIIFWSLSEWDMWSSTGGFGYWFADNFWSLVVLGVIIVVIAVTVRGDSPAAGITPPRRTSG